MKDVHFKPDPKKPAKKQAKELLELLSQKGELPIQRAKMRLKITVGLAAESVLRRELVWEEEGRTEDSGAGQAELIVLIKPGLYRQVEDAAKRVNAVVLVVSLAVAGVKEPKEQIEQVEQLDSRLESIKISDVAPVSAASAEEPKHQQAAKAPSDVANKRIQKEEQRMAGLMGVLNDDDDDDWKNEGKKKKGKGKKKK